VLCDSEDASAPDLARDLSLKQQIQHYGDTAKKLAYCKQVNFLQNLKIIKLIN